MKIEIEFYGHLKDSPKHTHTIVGETKGDFLKDENIIKPLFSSDEYWKVVSSSYIGMDEITYFNAPNVRLLEGDFQKQSRCIYGMNISLFSIIFVQEFIDSVMCTIVEGRSVVAAPSLNNFILGIYTVKEITKEIGSDFMKSSIQMKTYLPAYVHYLKSWRSALALYAVGSGTERYNPLSTIKTLDDALEAIEGVYGREFIESAKPILE